MKIRVFIATVAAMLVVVPVASAGSALLSGYGTSGSKPVVQVKTAAAGAKAPTKTAGPSTLPFTGLDLAGFLVVGASLFGVGLVVRRAGRES